MISFKQKASEKKQEELNELRSRSAAEKFNYPAESKSNILDNLDRLTFNDLQIPVTNIKITTLSNIIQHQPISSEGNVLEKLGRPSIIVNCTAVFANSLIPGKNDNWVPDDLYPRLFNQIRNICIKGETYKLVIPTIGIYDAKLVSFNSSLEAKIRQGEIVELQFIEDYSEELNRSRFLQIDPAATAQKADELSTKLTPSLDSLGVPKYKDTLFDTVKKIQAIIAYPNAVFNEITRDISNLEGRIRTNIKAIKQNYNSSHAQYNQLMYRMKADCKELRKEAEKVSQSGTATIIPIEYTNDRRRSPSEVLKLLNITLGELYKLNPQISNSYFIEAGTVIKYIPKEENIGRVSQ